MTGLALDEAAWNSAWRSRAPGDKALLALGLVICALVLPTWPACPLVLVAALALALGPAGVPWRPLLRALRAPLLFTVLGAASVIVELGTATGPGLALSPDWQGRAAGLVAHALAGSTAVLLLAATTPLSDLLPRLRAVGVPDAVTQIASLVYRLLFVLLVSLRTTREAQASRLGYAGVRASYRSSAALTAAVLTRAWNRAGRLEEGLAGRGLDQSLQVLPETRSSSPNFLLGTAAGLGLLVAVSLLAGGVGR